MGQLIKQFSIYGLGATIGKFLAVILLPIYASVFSPEDYGNLDFIMTLSSIVSVFGLLQIETGLQRFYYDYEKESDQQQLVSSAFVFTLWVTLLFTILSIALSPFISNRFLNGLYLKELIVSFLTMIPINLMTILFVDLRFRNKAIIFMILNVTTVVLSAVAAIIAVKVFDFGIMGVLLANAVVQYLVLIAGIIIWKKGDGGFSCQKNMVKQMLSFGFPMFPARLGSISNSYINRFFMIGMLSVYAIGIYAVALKIASAMQLVQMAFQLAWLPYLYSLLKKPNHKEQIIHTFKDITILLSALVLLFTLFTKEITLLLTNEEYIEAANYSPLLALYFCIYILKDVCDVGVNVTKKAIYTSYIFGVATVVNILLLIILTPIMELYGVVSAMLISNIVLLYLTLFVSEKLYHVGFPVLWSLIIIALTVVVMLLVINIGLSIWLRLAIASIVLVLIGYKYKDKIPLILGTSRSK